MGGSRNPDLPDWSYNASRKWKSNNIIVQFFRAKPFGGQFKSEEDVVRFFDERGVKITGVTVDPDPNDYLDEYVCESVLERYAETAVNAKLMTKEVFKERQKSYMKRTVKYCGFIIDGFHSLEHRDNSS